MRIHAKTERAPLQIPPHYVTYCGAQEGGMTSDLGRVDCGFCLNIARYEYHLLER